MSTDQALLENLEHHHRERADELAKQYESIPVTSPGGKSMIASVVLAVREAFIAGAMAEHQNPLP